MTIEDKIRGACFEISINLMWEKEALTTEKIDAHLDELQTMTEKLVDISKFYLENIESLDGNEDILIRAIKYIDQVHAIPPLRGNFNWFDYTLGALVELACPNVRITKSNLDFMNDLEKGIADYRDNVYNEDE